MCIRDSRERALGRDHRDLFETLVGFASLRKKQGRVAEAIGLYERAHFIKQRAYGPDHPELTEIRNLLDTLRSATPLADAPG